MIGKDLARQQRAEQSDGGELVLPAAPTNDIDIQIKTANAYPRDLKKALGEAMALASDPAIAGGLEYHKERAGKVIEGPSIRLAEIVAYAWKNLRIADHIVAIGNREVTVEGICFDLERNVAVRREVTKSIMSRDGRRFSDDMIQVTAQAACATARRNAIFAVVPGSFVEQIREQGRRTLAGGTDTDKGASDAIANMFGSFRRIGVQASDVLRKIGKTSAGEIEPADLARLRGIMNSIKEGEATAEEIFSGQDADIEPASKPEPGPAPPAVTAGKPTRSRSAAGVKVKTTEILNALSWLPDESVGRLLDGARMAAGGDEDIYAENVRLLPTIPRTMLEAALEDGGKPAWDSIFQAAKAQGALGV